MYIGTADDVNGTKILCVQSLTKLILIYVILDIAKSILDDLMSDVGAHGNPLPSRSVRLDSPSPLNPFGSMACLHSKDSMDEQRRALETRQLEALEVSKSSSGECASVLCSVVLYCIVLCCVYCCVYCCV